MTTNETVRDLWATYRDPDASAVWLICDRHDDATVALVTVGRDLIATEITYGELRERSERVAGVLRGLGVGAGDRVASLMEKGVDLVTLMLGAWRLGAVYVPLFTAFGSDAVADRLRETGTRLVLTDGTQAPKVREVLAADPAPGWTAVATGRVDGLPSWDDLLASATPVTERHAGGGRWPLVHMLTSGTTGRPKGVVHPLEYLAGWHSYLFFGLGASPDAAYWSAADPGWAYGLYTAVVAPLAAGIRTHLHSAPFTPDGAYEVLRRQGIENVAAAPTVFRALRRADPSPSGLRLTRASSAGEPLTADVNEWAGTALGLEVRDHFGQTEIGMPLGNAQHPAVSRPIKPGSMGGPSPDGPPSSWRRTATTSWRRASSAGSRSTLPRARS